MRSARDILQEVWFYKQRIKKVVEMTKAYYEDCFGVELSCDPEAVHVQAQHSVDDAVIAKLLQYDKRIEKAEEEITKYREIIDFIEGVCTSTLNEKELLVVREKYFSTEKDVTREQIARKHHYSVDWVAKTLVSAYSKLDQAFAVMVRVPEVLT